MKVCFAEDIKREDSGKHKFLNCLAKEFVKRGVLIVNNDADILLHVGRNISKFRAKKIVMRVDGLILNKDQSYEKKNSQILKYINKSDAIIYQSQFCKKSYEKFLKVEKKNEVIFNGANPEDFLPRNRKNFFLANCRWRPHKREKEICQSFLTALKKGLNSSLIIAGNAEKTINHPNIKYVGWANTHELKTLLSGAISTIHLSWLDWCPNSIVESVVAGCPVIYSSSGGSPEIGCGVKINDTNWDFKNPCFLYNPPQLNQDEIVNAMFYLKNNEIKVDKPELRIDKIAEKYLNFFSLVNN